MKEKKKKLAKGIRHFLNAASWRDPVHRAPLSQPIVAWNVSPPSELAAYRQGCPDPL